MTEEALTAAPAATETPVRAAPDPATPEPATPFHSLDDYIALSRLNGLALSPDGSRLVVLQQSLNAKALGYATSLWHIDLDGEEPARRLTRGTRGESGAAFTIDGDLLFVARRSEPGISEDDAKAALWRLPAQGGEAHVLTRRPAGVSGVVAASAGDRIFVVADTLRSATDEASERDLREGRKDKKVEAILHASYPVRHWDSDLGPAFPRLFTVEGTPLAPKSDNTASDTTAKAEPVVDSDSSAPDAERGTRDLTPDAGPALGDISVAPDGSFVVAAWEVPEARAAVRSTLVRIDTQTGACTSVLDFGVEGSDAFAPVVSPDGQWVAAGVETRPTPALAPRVELWVVRPDGTDARRLVADWDRWPTSATWLPDSSALLVVADDAGHSPVFRVPVAEGAAAEGAVADGTPAEGALAQTSTASEILRLTGDGSYSHVVVDPSGTRAYALRASYLYPPEVVRIDLTGDATLDERVTRLRGPAERPVLPGQLEDISTVVVDPDGTEVSVRGYLALPPGASPDSPAPLLLWIHGGPLGSWNSWSWRWNPWLMVAQGYAVLLPDPALSTGYGQGFIQRGWGAWGAAPFTDLMALTDATEQRADIDATRTAAMGGSFGGYMANWVAGHTDRFAAIVTHASLWALDQFGPTTDSSYYWRNEMTPAMARENSPHRFVSQIRTPMLVIHGDKDYRVPIGEGLRLWYELLSESGLPADENGVTPHRFLYFPDENHWVLSPQHAKVWYEVVSAFLADHVLGETKALPTVLG